MADTLVRKKCEWCETIGKVYSCHGMELCKACTIEFHGGDEVDYAELYEQEKAEGYIYD